MPVEVDMTAFYRAIRQMMDVPHKEGSVVLNKSVLQIAVGSGSGKGLVHFTKKATEARIREDMAQMVTTVGKRGGTHSAPRIVLIATNWLVKRGIRPMGWGPDEQLRWRCEVSQACERVLKARIQSRAYIAAGWLFAARDLAKKVPGNTLSNLSDRRVLMKDAAGASKSYAIPASRMNLSTTLYNVSNGAGVVVTPGMIQLAINSEVKNLEKYFTQQMDKAVRRAVGTKSYVL